MSESDDKSTQEPTEDKNEDKTTPDLGAELEETREAYRKLNDQFMSLKKERDDAAAYARKTKQETDAEKARKSQDFEALEKNYREQIEEAQSKYTETQNELKRLRIKTQLAEQTKDIIANFEVYNKFEGDKLDIDDSGKVYHRDNPLVDPKELVKKFVDEQMPYLKPNQRVAGHGTTKTDGSSSFVVPDPAEWNAKSKAERKEALSKMTKEQRAKLLGQ